MIKSFNKFKLEANMFSTLLMKKHKLNSNPMLFFKKKSQLYSEEKKENSVAKEKIDQFYLLFIDSFNFLYKFIKVKKLKQRINKIFIYGQILWNLVKQ